MKPTRHTPEQVINKLREADAMRSSGRSVTQVLQDLGVGEQTFHRWRNQYGGAKSEEDTRRRRWEDDRECLARAARSGAAPASDAATSPRRLLIHRRDPRPQVLDL
jgi:transposase-like protein